MTVYWPDDLPQRVVTDGYTRGVADSRVFTSMDSGLDKSRSRGIAAEPVACQLYLARSQYARWLRFWKEDTGGGILPFLIPDQNFDGIDIATSDELTITTEEDVVVVGVYNWLVIFGKETPQVRVVPNSATLYNLSFTLLKLPY